MKEGGGQKNKKKAKLRRRVEFYFLPAMRLARSNSKEKTKIRLEFAVAYKSEG